MFKKIVSKAIRRLTGNSDLPKIREELKRLAKANAELVCEVSRLSSEATTRLPLIKTWLTNYDKEADGRQGTTGVSYQFYGNFWGVFEGRYPGWSVLASGCGTQIGKQPTEGALFWKIYQRS